MSRGADAPRLAHIAASSLEAEKRAACPGATRQVGRGTFDRTLQMRYRGPMSATRRS
jgi:hypothetical protein